MSKPSLEEENIALKKQVLNSFNKISKLQQEIHKLRNEIEGMKHGK